MSDITIPAQPQQIKELTPEQAFAKQLRDAGGLVGDAAEMYAKMKLKQSRETLTNNWDKLIRKISDHPKIRQAANIGKKVAVGSAIVGTSPIQAFVSTKRAIENTVDTIGARMEASDLIEKKLKLENVKAQISREPDTKKRRQLEIQKDTLSIQIENLERMQNNRIKSAEEKFTTQEPTIQERLRRFKEISSPNPTQNEPQEQDSQASLEDTAEVINSTSEQETEVKKELHDLSDQSQQVEGSKLPPLTDNEQSATQVNKSLEENKPDFNMESINFGIKDFMQVMTQVNNLKIDIDISSEPIDGYAVTLNGEQVDVLKQNTQMNNFLRSIVTFDRKLLEEKYPNLQSQENNYYQYGLTYSLTKSLCEALKVQTDGRNIPINALLRSLIMDAGTDLEVIIDNTHNNLLKNFGWAPKVSEFNKRVVARYLYDIINTVESSL